MPVIPFPVPPNTLRRQMIADAKAAGRANFALAERLVSGGFETALQYVKAGHSPAWTNGAEDIRSTVQMLWASLVLSRAKRIIERGAPYFWLKPKEPADLGWMCIAALDVDFVTNDDPQRGPTGYIALYRVAHHEAVD